MIKQIGALFFSMTIICFSLCADENLTTKKINSAIKLEQTENQIRDISKKLKKQPSYGWLKFKYKGLQIVALSAIGLNFLDQTTKQNVWKNIKNFLANNELIQSAKNQAQTKYASLKEILHNFSSNEVIQHEPSNNEQMRNLEQSDLPKELAKLIPETNLENLNKEMPESLEKKDNN